MHTCVPPSLLTSLHPPRCAGERDPGRDCDFGTSELVVYVYPFGLHRTRNKQGPTTISLDPTVKEATSKESGV
jgi:hypothetical protein